MMSRDQSQTSFERMPASAPMASLPAEKPALARLRWRSRAVALGLIAAFAGCALMTVNLGGCSKPPPPPPVTPPPPPPPPPPPADVNWETLKQELKSDARVQFAASATMGEDKLDLAKSIVSFVDALARGDSAKLTPMLDGRAKQVLEELKNSGGWDEAVKKIEAARVVLIASGVDVSGIASAAPSAGSSTDLKAMMLAGIDKLPDTMKAQAKAAIEAIPADQLAATAQTSLQTTLELAKSQGLGDEVIKPIEAQLATLAGAANTQHSNSGDALGILIAIQEPTGAYLTGWAAVQGPSGWLFTNAPSQPQVRPRASGFDGIGPEGFTELQLAAEPVVTPPKPEGDGEGKGGGSSSGGSSPSNSPSAPGPSPAPSEPSRRRNTPSGPVNVPG